MTEYYSDHATIIQKICWACLSTKHDVHTMSDKEIKWYQSLVSNESTTESELEHKIRFCTICKHLLRKLMKYHEQWQRANCYINMFLQDKDNFKPQQLSNYNYIKTTQVLYLGPVSNVPVLDVPVLDVPVLDVPVLDVSASDIDVKVEDKTELSEGETFTDNDEVPLVLLRSDDNDVCNRKVKKKKRKKSGLDLEQEIKTENGLERNEQDGKCMKSRKVVKDGFSSRMVQETKEYVVIKLTKEQVLKEMEENANSDKFKRSLYKCDKCVKGFNFEDVLQSHMKKHSKENGELQCDMCTQYCPSAVSLRGHIKSHTTRYKCKICGYVRLSRQHLLEHHAISHTSAATEYTCEHCYFTTNKRTVIQRHVKSHKKSERHTCEECGRLFHNIESLRVHTARHDKSKSLQCEYCTRKFIYPSLLQKHVQSVHVHKDYYCVECDVKFKSLDNLKLHFKKAKRHRDSSSYTHECPQCTDKFFSASSRSVHLTAVHGQPKQHSCSVCRRLYSSRESLLTHSRRVHCK